ncbi:hypothetical protein CWB79_01325 [Pseudoalteromonas sp. S1649]|nr:hypothetical protein CWB80_10735 [Pseudoalteromonas sp. S1650]TMP69745.1 hypothetical protein CWB79_01325 [Pseudoalteromonas sp. S1649]
MYTALLILTIEPLLFAINALPKSLLIPTETHILRWLGYKYSSLIYFQYDLDFLNYFCGIYAVLAQRSAK